MILHYSQTDGLDNDDIFKVSLNYDFTLLSNMAGSKRQKCYVSLNYDFTLLSNRNIRSHVLKRFHSTMILHYSQTTITEIL